MVMLALSAAALIKGPSFIPELIIAFGQLIML